MRISAWPHVPQAESLRVSRAALGARGGRIPLRCRVRDSHTDSGSPSWTTVRIAATRRLPAGSVSGQTSI
jgi:hypothetical protein